MSKRALMEDVPKDVVENIILLPELSKRLKLYERLMPESKVKSCAYDHCDRRMIRKYNQTYYIDNINDALDKLDHRTGYICTCCSKWFCKDHMPNTKHCKECEEKIMIK